MKKSYTPAGGGGLQVRRCKNPRQRESLDNDKDKTDSATTNKQDPQDTPAGRQILCGIVSYILLPNYIYTFSGILSVVQPDILSGILSDILSDIVFGPRAGQLAIERMSTRGWRRRGEVGALSC